jgi:hypothetical protein
MRVILSAKKSGMRGFIASFPAYLNRDENWSK